MPASTRTSAARTGATVPNRLIVNGLALLFAAYAAYPLIWLLFASFKTPDALTTGDVFSFNGIDIGASLTALFTEENGAYSGWYLNSLLYAVGGAALSTVVSIMAGYAFDKFEFRGKKLLFGLVMLAVMVPGAVLSLPLYLAAQQVGLLNTFWAVLIPVIFNPFGVYLARTFTASYVPDELIEAGRIDGATRLKAFGSIGAPLLGSAAVTIFLFQLTAIWNNFLLPLMMLTDNRLYPLSLGLFTWNSQAAVSPEFYGVTITGSLLALLPLVIAFLTLQRFWVAGVTAGAVKG